MSRNDYIAIDIDGCLNNFGKWSDMYAKEYFATKMQKPYFADITKYDLQSRYDFTSKQETDFYQNYYEKIIDHIARPNAAYALQALAEKQAYKILVVTARTQKWVDKIGFKTSTPIDLLTENWLAKNEIPYDDIAFTEDKFAVLREYKVFSYVDDFAQNIEQCRLHVPVPIIFSNSYNLDYCEPEVMRIASWLDFYHNVVFKGFTNSDFGKLIMQKGKQVINA